MSEYVYGIVGAEARPPSSRGIADAPLRLVDGDGAAALVSNLVDDGVRLGREEVMVHARVLEQALMQGTVLPMRFGVVMSGPEEIRRRLLADHGGELRAQLDELDGKVEIRIRGTYDEDRLLREVISEDQAIASRSASVRNRPADASYYERIELGERIAQAVERKREHDSEEIIDALGQAALTVDLTQPAHERIAVNASFLLARAKLDEFDEILERLASGYGGRIRFKYTGPLPPHSFVQFAENR